MTPVLSSTVWNSPAQLCSISNSVFWPPYFCGWCHSRPSRFSLCCILSGAVLVQENRRFSHISSGSSSPTLDCLRDNCKHQVWHILAYQNKSISGYFKGQQHHCKNKLRAIMSSMAKIGRAILPKTLHTHSCFSKSTEITLQGWRKAPCLFRLSRASAVA